MATLEHVSYNRAHPEVVNEQLRWVESQLPPIDRLPQICWETGDTWSEANMWAFEMALDGSRDIKTVRGAMDDVLIYAKWLEAEQIDWWHFPERESERCLVKFKGALIQEMDNQIFAPRTASQCMTTVVSMYRWFKEVGLLSNELPTWTERHVGVRLKDNWGFDKTIDAKSTNLSIRNRTIAGGFRLEDGVLPVSQADMRKILRLARTMTSEELRLMLLLGFQTGLRIGSITDLKVDTILNASRDPVVGWYRLSVGPAARPAVKTKGGVSGHVPIPTDLLEVLREYASSPRRLMREAKADSKHRGLLFLTKNGHPYGSGAVNVEMFRFRQAARRSGAKVLIGFKFHRTRATFATELMRVALKVLDTADAVQFVREVCLHKHEKTTLRYVHFINTSKAMAKAANAFTRRLFGLTKRYGRVH